MIAGSASMQQLVSPMRNRAAKARPAPRPTPERTCTSLANFFLPPGPVRAVPVSSFEYRVIVGIVEPAAKLPDVQRAQTMIEDAPVPARRSAPQCPARVGMKAGNRAPPFL